MKERDMRDSEYKLYVYHKLNDSDILDCKQWAKDNFDKYEGMTSPLWNKCVQDEFTYICKERGITINY